MSGFAIVSTPNKIDIMGPKFKEVAFNLKNSFKRSQLKYFGQSKNSKKCILSKAERSHLSWKVTFDV